MNDNNDDEIEARIREKVARERADHFGAWPPGIYELQSDVKNPAADRRQRYDWRAEPAWTKGTRFVIREDPQYKWLEIYPLGEYSHKAVALRLRDTFDDKLRTAIVTKLLPDLKRCESREMELRWWFIRNGNGGDSAYRILEQAFLERRFDVTWLDEAETAYNKKLEENDVDGD